MFGQTGGANFQRTMTNGDPWVRCAADRGGPGESCKPGPLPIDGKGGVDFGAMTVLGPSPPSAAPEGGDLTGLAGYQLRLPSFEGPLDVLLRLIEREQLAITDVSLVAVTDQFVAHLASLEDSPPATIAEFAAVAGRLVLLKSRTLIPRPPAPEETEPDGLVRQLTEYRLLRAAVERFAAADRGAGAAFARGEGIARPEAPTPRLAAHEAEALARALRRRLTISPEPSLPVGLRPAVTLREMAERLLETLGDDRSGCLSFHGFAGACRERQEILVGFVAVLSLVRRRVIDAEQDGLFEDIRLRRVGADENDPVRSDAAAVD